MRESAKTAAQRDYGVVLCRGSKPAFEAILGEEKQKQGSAHKGKLPDVLPGCSGTNPNLFVSLLPMAHTIDFPVGFPGC